MVMEAKSHRRSLRALDWLNVFMSDVQTGIGPYLAIYLMATRHWDPAHIGLAMSAMGLASVVAQTPAGALTDRLRQKRWMIVAASVVVAIGCLWIVTSPALAGVIAAQALIGSTATIFPTAVAAITLAVEGVKIAIEVAETALNRH
jgi:MFS family permease